MSEAASNDLPGAEQGSDIGAAASGLTLGAQLAAARTAHEWTVEHVAAQLNLAPRQIQALESDNYSALPGMASVRGFVRAYAKLLRIDADPLIALIAGEQVAHVPQLEPKRTVSAAPFSDNRSLSSGRRRNSTKTVLAGLVLTLLAAGAFVVERMGGWPMVSQSLSAKFKGADAANTDTNTGSMVKHGDALASASADSVVEPLPSPQGLDQTSASPNSASVNQPVKADEVKTGAVKTDDMKAPATLQAPVAPAVKPAASEAVKPVADTTPKTVAPTAANGKNTLVFNVHKDAWIEVRDAHNVLLSRLVKAGSTEQVEVTQPVSLVVGNAAGVDIVFRGVPVETKTDAKSNVARLNLK